MKDALETGRGLSSAESVGDGAEHDFDAVQSITTEFAVAPESGTPPSIVAYLGKVKEGLRSTLLRNLLNIDVERRRLKGERPSADDYLRWFPGQEDLILQAFIPTSAGPSRRNSPAEPEVEATVRRSAEPTKPIVLQLGEYHLIRELGRGGMGIVFEASHSTRNDHVALKTLPEVEGDALHRFKREFRSLADINHPNLIGLHTLECDGGQWLFTMDLIRGPDFFGYVRPAGRLDVARLRSALAQLVTGVMALHNNDVVHLDLKPSNVMVEDGRVILLDFGLVQNLGRSGHSATHQQVAGTPAYMSPEQARGEPGSPPCDWYAVGVMLYQALSGNLPFKGNPLEILHLKQQRDAPPISGDDDVPEDLRQLSMALLSRSPSERPDAPEIARVASVRAIDARSSGANSVGTLIGRQDQLSNLHRAFEAVHAERRPVVALIGGRSGEGKTSLVNAFLESLPEDSRSVVLSGRCYDRESVPFKALDSVIDAIGSHLRSLPHAEGAALLPDDSPILARLFPVLCRVDAIDDLPRPRIDLNEQEVRGRAAAALREILLRLGERGPLILFIDNLQWGDAASAEILLQALSPPSPPKFLLIGTYRSDEADESAFLRGWETTKRKLSVEVDVRSLSVGPLSPEECIRLTVELVGRDDELIQRRAREFHAEARGNPFLVRELIGCFDPETDSLRSLAMSEMIDEKLGRLPGEAKRLLEVVAIAGKAISMVEASAVAGHAVPSTATLTRMRSERLIRFLGPDHDRAVDIYHDRIREMMLSVMDQGDQRGLHLAMAEHIERTLGVHVGRGQTESAVDPANLQAMIPPHRLFDLSFHFDGARERRKARTYGLLAAEQARRQSSLEVAVEQYDLARRNDDHWEPSIRRRILMGLGETLTLLGHYKDAEECLTEANTLAEELLDRSEVGLLRGRLATGESRYAEGVDRCTHALRDLGVWIPRSTGGLVVGILGEVLTRACRSVGPRRRSDRPGPVASAARSRRSMLVVHLLNQLMTGYWFRSSPSVLWASLASMNRAERGDLHKLIGSSYNYHCMTSSMLGLRSRSLRYASRALSLLDENDLTARMHHLFFKGLSQYIGADYDGCTASLSTAMELIGRTGDMWYAQVMRLHLALCDIRVGRVRSALVQIVDAYDVSLRIGDFNTACDFVNLTSMLTGGAFGFEEMRANLIPIPDNYQATNQILVAESRWHLHHGRTGEALNAARGAFELMKKHLVINHITMPTVPVLLQAIRMHAEARGGQDAAKGRSLLLRGDRFARWAARFGSRFPTDNAVILRELAAYHAVRGRVAKALDVVERSCRVAERQGARYDLAFAQAARARYRLRIGEGSDTDVNEAENVVAQFDHEVDEIRPSRSFLTSPQPVPGEPFSKR